MIIVVSLFIFVLFRYKIHDNIRAKITFCRSQSSKHNNNKLHATFIFSLSVSSKIMLNAEQNFISSLKYSSQCLISMQKEKTNQLHVGTKHTSTL